MALALKKTVLSKNLSLLKYIRGRSLATVINRTPASQSAAVPWRSRKENKAQHLEQTKKLSSLKRCYLKNRIHPIRCCISCPTISQLSSKQFSISTSSPASYEPINSCTACSASPTSAVNAYLLKPSRSQITHKRSYSKPCCDCQCPLPCPPCGCSACCSLPPPSNQPPHCVQYMTGYYYYPYGYWFCGPYHVTGTCVPVGPSEACKPSSDKAPKIPSASVCSAATAVITAHAPATASKIAANENIISNVIPQPRTAKLCTSNVIVAPKVNDCNTKLSNPNATSKDVLKCYMPHTNQKVKEGRNSSKKPPGPPCSPISSGCSKSVTKKTAYPLPKSYYETLRKGNSSPIRHKTITKRHHEVCPALEKPKLLMSREERDRPIIKAGLFDYLSIPRYRNPNPQPPTID